MESRVRLVVAACFFALTLPMVAQAQQQEPPPGEPHRGMPAQPPGNAAPAGMAEAVRRAERRTRGQVLNVESMQFQGREVHRVKVLAPGGRVMVVVDDPGEARPRVVPQPRNEGTKTSDDP